MLAVRHYLPWLAPHFDCHRDHALRGLHKGSLSKQAVEVILHHNALDDLIYNYGQEQLDMQIEHLRQHEQVESPVQGLCPVRDADGSCAG